MKLKIVGVAFAILLLFIGAAAVLRYQYSVDTMDTSSQILRTNDIESEILAGDSDQAIEITRKLRTEIKETPLSLKKEYDAYTKKMLLVFVGFLLVIFLYIYFAVIHPFAKLHKFAGEIARGNLDAPLKVERSNYFGSFTWAFDHMRSEYKRAKTCEAEAIENNKTVIASLSHDIKTPIAGILAASEAMEAGMDTSPEKRKRYLNIIMNKANEVTHLTNDLFLHSLTDMEKLKVDAEPLNLVGLVKKMAEEYQVTESSISFQSQMEEAWIQADEKRLTQIVENLVNNAKKYAPGKKIDLLLTRPASENQPLANAIPSGQSSSEISLTVRDYGSGIPDEDLPFIFEKFYRGHNIKDQQGSGLGLYIVKYLADKMGGSVEVRNVKPGLEVRVTFATSPVNIIY